MRVSIIIPTYNEAQNIVQLIRFLKNNRSELLQEIIVSDGGSQDDTLALAEQAGAVALNSPQKGRAVQLNHGALVAKGDLLYFVHADTIPPQSYLADINQAIGDGYEIGRYLSKYQSKSWLLKINAFLSRLDTFSGMGGDQTLFITRKLFKQSGGFDIRMKIMEEFEFCDRARKLGKYKIIPKPVLISVRKYDNNGWLAVQRANYTVFRMYQKGATQQELASAYKRMLHDH